MSYKIDELEKEMYKYFLKDYAEEKLTRSPKGNRKAYICPFCESGTGPNGTGAFNIKEEDNYFNCFSCHNGGDIYELVGKLENLGTFTERFEFVKAKYEDRIEEISNDQMIMQKIKDNKQNHTHSYNAHKPHISNETLNPNQILAEYQNNATKQQKEGSQAYIRQLQDNLFENENKNAMEFLENRGLNKSTISKAQIGYDEKTKAVVFPYNPYADYTYYQTRSIEEEKKYHKPLEEILGKEPIYNENSLYLDKYCFICEGVFDALSIMQITDFEVNAVALGGTTGIKKLEKAFIYAKATNQEIKAKFITCFDNDDAGKQANKETLKLFKKYNIPITKARFTYAKYKKSKDANEMLLSNEEQLKKDILKACNIRNKNNNTNSYDVAKYLAEGLFDSDISYFKDYQDRKTGYVNIDEHFTVYPGMMALGGGASVGKSTFAVNLAMNLIEQGETVLYFALEQTPIELITKILARNLYEKTKFETNKAYDLTNYDIKNGKSNELLNQVKQDFIMQYNNKFIIKRADFSYTAEDIKKEVEEFIDNTGVIPIVIIDYLQLLRVPNGMDIRLGTDENIKTLKKLQLDNDLFLMVISNFNRDSYNNNVTYKSFKESGCIEYTADYVWGLQLAKTKSLTGDDNSKSIVIQKEQGKLERSIELVSLKNRQGRQCWNVFFKYQVTHDYFEVDTNTEYEKQDNKTKKGAPWDK